LFIFDWAVIYTCQLMSETQGLKEILDDVQYHEHSTEVPPETYAVLL
jgi:hypothetical protein